MKIKKFKLTTEELNWVKRNLHNRTTKEQFEHIMANRAPNDRARYTSFRTELYNHGLKKCQILIWSEQETQYLLDNYSTCGNIEIAKMIYTKKRLFSKKNIEKKMRLMGLKRTPEMLIYIREKAKKKGVYKEAVRKMKQTIGVAKEGEKRIWQIGKRPKVVIKINGNFKHYARYRYLQLHGNIKPGYKVYHKDGNPLNVEDNNLVALPAGSCNMLAYRKNIKDYYKESKVKQEAPAEVKPTFVNQYKPAGIAVRLDRKTVIYVKPGTNIKELKSKLETRTKY